MKPLPHEYEVSVHAPVEGYMSAQSPDLPALVTAAPAEFDGPGDCWSPETLFLASIANCFALTFRAVSKASRIQWQSLDCSARGTLDKSDGKMRFTSVQLDAKLQLAEGESQDKALRLMHKSEENCLISNSLAVEIELNPAVFF